ncbi:MAG: hypothetical protein FWF65_01785 [Bacteroidetes bacterium]|nr:hypothetical protein [Bacteroidota bacterium]
MKKQTTQNAPLTIDGILASLDKTDRMLSEKFAETERILKEMAAEREKYEQKEREREQKREQEREERERQRECERKERERKREQEREERERKREQEREERERQREWERKETERYFKKMFAETDRQLKINSKEIGGIAHSNGEVAESYFFNSFKKYPHFAGQDYYSVEPNKSYYSAALDMQDEYDLVLYNGASVAIIEIKYKVRKDDIEQTLKKAETFRKLFPQYKDYAIYLGLAGFHVYKNAEDEAIKHGIAVIKQVGKNRIVNDGHLRAF